MDAPADTPELPRFDAATRRAFLKRAAAVGALALVPGLASACSNNNDKDVFADASSTTGSVTSSSTAGSGTGSSDTTTTAGSSTSSTTSTPTTPSGDPLPDGAQLEVAFTYTADANGFGAARNPFIAVWVESAAGDLVANLSVWYNAPRGERWINNLSSWYAADAAYYQANGADDLEAKTGATRPAGSYTVQWDGTDAAGKRAPQGDYTVLVESAREHGTHSLTSTTISLGTAGATASMGDDGELSAASATYTV